MNRLREFINRTDFQPHPVRKGDILGGSQISKWFLAAA
uniref:GG16489 n=1 Tax=Drosophila erecta TaxID=7220 RepID=B3P494_DROER